MTKRTLLFESDFTGFTYPANNIIQDGWTHEGPGFWNDRFREIILATPRPLGTSAPSSVKTPSGFNSVMSRLTAVTNQFVEIELYWSMGINIAPPTGVVTPEGSRIHLKSWDGGADNFAFQLFIDYMFDWYDVNGTTTAPWITITAGTQGTIFQKQNADLIALPTQGNPTWNGIKYRLEFGKAPRVWIDAGWAGIWAEVTNPDTSVVFNLGFNAHRDIWLQLRGSDDLGNLETGVGRVSWVYEASDPESLPIGMTDEDGLIIIGVDPDDDGSGTSSGGGNGLGGGGDGGIAAGGSGLVGSGSEGNAADDGSLTGTGGASGWRGSGTGIDIIGWNMTTILDGFGFAEIHLKMVDSWNKAIKTFMNRKFIITDDIGKAIFRGYVRDLQEMERYQGKLIIEHIIAPLQRRETTLNFAETINLNGSIYDTAAIITSTKITLRNGFTPTDIGDGTFAVMVVPGPTAASSNENFNTIITASVTGVIANINSDDDNEISLIEVPTTGSIEISGVYSGTRSEVEGITLFVKAQFQDPFVFGNTVHIDLYDYDAAAYDTDIIDSQLIGGGIGLGRSRLLEFETKIKVDAINYIESAGDSNVFKVRVRVEFGGGAQTVIYIKFVDFIVFTDPQYTGANFPITNRDTPQRVTVTGNPVASNLNVGDTLVIGKRNDLVLIALAEEFFFGFTVDVDTAFLNYTASNFALNNMTTIDSIRSVLKKDQGVMYFRDDLNTLFFRKIANLDIASTVLSDDPSDPLQVKFLDNKIKVGDQYIQIQVTGAIYKTYDGESKVRATSDRLGGTSNLVLRINDPSLLSITEAENRITSELALLDQNREPTHSLIIPTANINLAGIYPGILYQVKRRGTTYPTSGSGIPLRMLNVSSEGYNKSNINFELGWKGTTPLDQTIDRNNEMKRLIRQTYHGMNTRPIGDLGGNEVTSHGHAGFTNRQATTTITSTGAGTGVSTTAVLETKYGMQVTANNNTGTFTSATILLQISFDGGSNYIDLLKYVFDSAGAHVDSALIPKHYASNLWAYASGTDLLTDTVFIRYNVSAISLAGDADIDIILLQSE